MKTRHTHTRRAFAPWIAAVALLTVQPQPVVGQQIDSRALARAEEMRRSRADADRVATAMRTTFRQSGAQTTTILQRVGYSASQSAQGVKDSYRASHTDVATWMRGAGFEDPSTVGALVRLRAAPGDIARGLVAAGINPNELGTAFRSARIDAASAVKGFKAGGFDGRRAVEGLTDGGYPAVDIRTTLEAEFTDTDAWVPAYIQILIRQGAPAADVAPLLVQAGYAFQASLEAMRSGGYGAFPAAEALIDAYPSLDAEEIATGLADGQPADAALLTSIGQLLVRAEKRGIMVALSPAERMDLARTVGASAYDAARWVRASASLSSASVLPLLLQSGYPASETGEAAAGLGMTPIEAATALRDSPAGVGVAVVYVVVAVVVSSVTFGSDAPARVAEVLVDLGFGAEGIISAMAADGQEVEDIVDALLEAGLEPDAIVSAGLGSSIGNVFRTVVRGIKLLLRRVIQAGFSIAKAVVVFVQANVPVEDILDAIAGLLSEQDGIPALLEGAGAALAEAGITPNAAADMLVTKGYSGAHAAQILAQGYALNAETVMSYLRTAGLSGGDLAEAASEGLQASASDVTRILLNQGFSAEEVASALSEGMDLTPTQVARQLHAQRIRVSRILNVLTSILNLQHEAAMAIIDNLRG